MDGTRMARRHRLESRRFLFWSTGVAVTALAASALITFWMAGALGVWLAVMPVLLCGMAAVKYLGWRYIDILARENTFLDDQNMRMSETIATQWAVMHAVPAQIALLDRDGNVVALNRAWQQFGMRVGKGDADYGTGANLIDLCEASDGPYGRDGAEIALALREVVSKRRPLQALEYANRWTAEQSWFRLIFAALDHEGDTAAVVVQLDITDMKRAEIQLKQKTIALQNVTSGIPGIVYQFIAHGAGDVRFTFVSPQITRILGYEADAIVPHSGLPFHAIAHPDDREWMTRSKQDFVRDGIDGDTWRAEFRVLARTGEVRWVQAFARLTIAETGDKIVDGVMLDVSEYHAAAEKITELQHNDPRSGLFNRQYLLGQIGATLKGLQDGGDPCALIIVEVGDFNDIVSTYGVPFGDDVLRLVGARLTELVRRHDTVGRIESARFGVLATDISSADVAVKLANKLTSGLRGMYALPGQEVSIRVRVGLTFTDRAGRVPVEILRQAIVALNHATRDSSDGVVLYADHMGQEPELRIRIRSALATALSRNELLLRYQPRVDIKTGVVVGCEALIRWNHPVFGIQPPNRFIAIAEQSGIIIEIGRWVINEACRQVAAWRRAGLENLVVSVNISAVQLQQDYLPAVLEDALAAAGVPAASLQLEITESAFVGADGDMAKHLAAINDLGISLAIDDFGTGYSSLSYLRELPVEMVKIDRAFIVDAATSQSDAEIVRSIVAICRTLGLQVVAEGVETQEQLAFLASAGVDEAQGFYLAHPMEAADFVAFVRDFRPASLSSPPARRA